MTKAPILGIDAVRGAPRSEPRSRDTAKPTPEAEPTDGTSRSSPSGERFSALLQRQRASRPESDAAQYQPADAAQQPRESAEVAETEPEAVISAVGDDPVSDEPQPQSQTATTEGTDAAALSIVPTVTVDNAPSPPITVSQPSAASGQQPEMVADAGSPDHRRASHGHDLESRHQGSHHPHHHQSNGRIAITASDRQPDGDQSLPIAEERIAGSGDQRAEALRPGVPIPAARPSDDGEGLQAADPALHRAGDAPSRSGEASFRLESASRPGSDAPNLMKPSAPADSPKTGLQGSGGTLGMDAEEGLASPRIVSRGLSAAVAQRGGVVHVRLVPASLGEVRIQMSIDALTVSVRIEATTPSAQGLLNEHLTMLRSSLEAKGLTVDRLAVHLSPVSGSASSPQPSGGSGGSDLGQSMGQRQEHDAGGSPSRGRSDDEAAHGSAADEPPEEALDQDGSGRLRPAFSSRLRLRLSAVA